MAFQLDVFDVLGFLKAWLSIFPNIVLTRLLYPLHDKYILFGSVLILPAKVIELGVAGEGGA